MAKYSREQRDRAVDLYVKYERCAADVIHELGYPSKGALLSWYADPYSSWQRGSNENRNGRIRRYLPKGTGFEDLAQEDLDAIVGEINDTPMKLLGYKTPNEVWDEEIAKLQSKTTSPNTSVALTN